ncbi:hypothetical protein NQ314_012828 [Rhamnusium bicolor]|uniref:Integrase zinc-binding domain-containing protein n=1 Tax=Rhamnusium bicolor TaxID=1586634 RepID=A0AAV8XA38_9CUCU|nr:hypothetical protein NQ314_012828 [Rhamnusium bicolor]
MKTSINLFLKNQDDNSVYLSNEKYELIKDQVKQGKQEIKKTALSYRHLAKYDIINVGNEEKLIVPLKGGNEQFLYYVKNEELFNMFFETHINIGHGGRTRMLNKLNDKYKNITRGNNAFPKFCIPCQKKLF